MVSHLKVLIADEDIGSRKFLVRSLGPYAEVQEAEDGYEVLALIEQGLADQHPFNIVILDLDLPHIDGADVFSAIRALEDEHHIFGAEGVKVIAVSDSAEGADIYSAISIDCEQFLLKPIDPKRVIRLLDDLKESTLDPRLLPN